MKKKYSVLRFGEISLTDLLCYLLKNIWVVLLIVIAAALTAWSAVGAALPDSYMSSVTLSVRNTTHTSRWSDHIYSSGVNAEKLAKAIDDAIFSTDFASEELNKKLNVTVRASRLEATNLLRIAAYGDTPDEAYLYLSVLVDNVSQLGERAGLSNVSVRAVTAPTMPQSLPDYSNANSAALLAGMLSGVFACLAIIALYMTNSCIATRKAAERLLILPVVSALNKGAKGKGIDADLPLITSENARGCYTEQLVDATKYLTESDNAGVYKHIRLASPLIDSKRAKKSDVRQGRREAERLGLNLAMSMADSGLNVCLIDLGGEALAALGIRPSADRNRYPVQGMKLTIATAMPDPEEAAQFDKIISIAQKGEKRTEDSHILWVIASGRYTAASINAITVPDGAAVASSSILIYKLGMARDTRSYTVDSAALTVQSDEIYVSDLNDASEELDLLRWGVAIGKSLWRIRYKWMAAFALTTIAALVIGFVQHNSTYQMDTRFVVATADVMSGLSAETIEQMTLEEASELMENGDAQGKQFNGNALYPTSHAVDVNSMAGVLPSVLNARATVRMVEDYLGRSDYSVEMTVIPDEDGSFYTFSVRGSDRELLEEITEAFLAVAPQATSHSAGGLTFVADDSTVAAAGPSVSSALLIGWLLVISAGLVWAVVIGYFDRRLQLAYEVEAASGYAVLGRCSLARRKSDKSDGAAVNVKAIDVGVVRFAYDWAEKREDGSVLLITSALRREQTARLTRAIEMLLKMKGKRVAIADKVVCNRLMGLEDEALQEELKNLRGNSDVLLIDCPGAAVNGSVTVLAEKADGVLLAVRTGYADSERIAAASERLKCKDNVLGCVMID